MTITPTRSPLGAFYRSPLGVRMGNGYLYGWGAAVVSGTIGQNLTRPTLFARRNVVSLSCGQIHSGVIVGARLFMWGGNDYGELGVGATPAYSAALLQVEGNQWAQVATGSHTSFGIKSDGNLYAWGRNAYGELGNGGIGATQSTPYLVGSGWNEVSAGDGNVLGLQGTSLYAWGDSSETGRNQTGLDYGNAPTAVDTGVTAISAGFTAHAVLKGDALYTWGANDYGQLGLGDTTRRETPTYVSDGWKAIAAHSSRHMLGLSGNGDLYAWGANTHGQIGNGSEDDQLSPLKIGEGFASIAVARFASYGIKTNRQLWSWGGGSSSLAELYLGRGNSVYAYNVPGFVGSSFRLISGGGFNFAIGYGNAPVVLA